LAKSDPEDQGCDQWLCSRRPMNECSHFLIFMPTKLSTFHAPENDFSEETYLINVKSARRHCITREQKKAAERSAA
jgi:hypothetical protein